MWCLTTSGGKGVNTSPESEGKLHPFPAYPAHKAAVNQPYYLASWMSQTGVDTRGAQRGPSCLSRCRECGHSSYFGHMWTGRHRCHRSHVWMRRRYVYFHCTLTLDSPRCPSVLLGMALKHDTHSHIISSVTLRTISLFSLGRIWHCGPNKTYSQKEGSLQTGQTGDPSRLLTLDSSHWETLEHHPRSDLTIARVGKNVAGRRHLCLYGKGFSDDHSASLTGWMTLRRLKTIFQKLKLMNFLQLKARV